MPKEHLNSESMTPVIKKLQGLYTLPEHEDLPYLIEAIINDREIVDVLSNGAIAIRDICGPGKAPSERALNIDARSARTATSTSSSRFPAR